MDVLRQDERHWLTEAVSWVSSAGASTLAEKFVPVGAPVQSRDSAQDRSQLRDLLAELRVAVDLVEHGFGLSHEAPGKGAKSVDFFATACTVRVWVEVKRFNPDEGERHFLESVPHRKSPQAYTAWMKDDVRIGRYVRDGGDKMPRNPDPKVVVVYVENLSEYSEDTEIFLFGRTKGRLCFTSDGKYVEVAQGREATGRWSVPGNCPLSGVVVAAPQAGWPRCGPISKVLFVNPAHLVEAQHLLQVWPMRAKYMDDAQELTDEEIALIDDATPG